MKHLLRHALQKFLGFQNYLFLFSLFTIKRLLNTNFDKEFTHFIKIIPNVGIILDIGANIGITTVPIAIKKNNAVVYSFEPMPENIKALKRVIKFHKLKNVKILEIALGDNPGKLPMVMPIINNVKMQGLSHIKCPKDLDTGSEITVNVEKLDNITELMSANKVSAIKIDIENFEYFALKGGKALLSKFKPIIYCELWKNEQRTQTIDYLKALGYSAKVFHQGELISFDNQDTVNFFFIYTQLPHENRIS